MEYKDLAILAKIYEVTETELLSILLDTFDETLLKTTTHL